MVRSRNASRPAAVWICWRSRACSRSFSAMATERPWPNSAVVHCGRTGQRSHVGIEFDDGAERKGLHVTLGAFDRAVAEIEPEGRLRKLAAVLRLPGLAHDFPASAEHLVHERAVDVPAIDQ